MTVMGWDQQYHLHLPNLEIFEMLEEETLTTHTDDIRKNTRRQHH
jgi:hypothetical protein